MSGEQTSSLTVVKLKALCILNDLPTSGKKSILVERLLEAGLSNKEVGLPSKVGKKVPSIPKKKKSEPETLLSMEDEDTLTPSEPEETDEGEEEIEEESILDAEILDAEILDEDPPKSVKKIKTKEIKQTREGPATLLDILRKPQVAAVLLALVIVGAGGYYYLDNQLDPFTAEQLRYGDSMQYQITGDENGLATFLATEGFVELVMDQLETEDDICKISIDFGGLGSLSITNGGIGELVNEGGSTDRLGAVGIVGGMGAEWLAVETVNTNSLDPFRVNRHLSLGTLCEFGAITGSGTADLTSTTYTELRNQDTKATQLEWGIDLPSPIGKYQGTTMSYGVGGLLGGLETLAPGLALMMQPVELQQLFANDIIDKGATGSNLGWDWRVLDEVEFGGEPVWKIIATHHDIDAYCLGSATMNLWVEEGNPWAAKQTVDVLISDDQASQSGCSPTSQLLNDYVLPEGELELHHTFSKTLLSRGQKQLDLGLSYTSKPQVNQLGPSNSELESWGEYELHMPDDSSLREYTFEDAITCFDHWPNAIAPAASQALEENGYIWRGTTQQISPSTDQWNLSWVAADKEAGWVKFNLTGTPSEENCQFDSRGSDEQRSHNRESIPKTLNITKLESRFSDSSRYNVLFGPDRFFTSSGTYQDDVQVGYLIAVPGDDIGSILSQIGDGGDGVVTFDVSRSWDEDVLNEETQEVMYTEHHQLNLLADAAEGRLIGWSIITNRG
ncbi:MAG: SAP domain-containing protein [Euryarchaeota archaeon]|nr:SAP domain-containing protein [Euryarchaeota archaeon]